MRDKSRETWRAAKGRSQAGVPGPETAPAAPTEGGDGGWREATRWELGREWPLLLLLLLLLVAGLVAYPHLPERVPAHWNLAGEVDRYQSRFWGAFAMPLLGLGIYLLMLVAPRWDPRRENYARFLPVYRFTRTALVLLTAVLQGVILAAGLGRAVPVGLIVQCALSSLFLFLGNQLGRVRPNYFFGIRTPWTLASEEVWRRTHRLGAWLLVGAGLVGLASAPLPAPFNAALFFGGLAVAVVWSTLYSYFVFRRLKAFRE